MEYDQDAHDRPTKPIRVPANWTEPAADKPAERPDDLPIDAADAGGEDRQTPAAPRREEPPARPIPRPSAGEAGASTVVARNEVYQAAPPQWRDTIAAPPPLPQAVSPEAGARRIPCALWALVVFSLLISLASLALNAVLVYRLVAVREKVVGGLDASIAALDKFGGRGFQYEYHLKRTIPFSGDIPFKQEMNFPFEGDIPINTTVAVPIDAGLLGTFQVKVPINTNVHIKTSIPIRVDESFHIETQVPIDMKIPIDVQPDDPAIQELIGPIRTWLLELRELF
jgi:hypothetical protein